MRTIRLLAASLLVALCAGFSSCGDDELEVTPPEYNVDEPLIDKCLKYGITDYKNIELLSLFEHGNNTIINLGQVNFSGLKDDKLWLASFPSLIGLTSYHLIEIVGFTKAMENMKMLQFNR